MNWGYDMADLITYQHNVGVKFIVLVGTPIFTNPVTGDWQAPTKYYLNVKRPSGEKLWPSGALSGANGILTDADGNAPTVTTVTELGDAYNQCLAWTLSGITANNTTNFVMYWALTNTDTTRTVSLYRDSAMSQLMAVGSVTGDGTITLAPQNASGVGGTVQVAYTQDDADANNKLQVTTNAAAVTYISGPGDLNEAGEYRVNVHLDWDPSTSVYNGKTATFRVLKRFENA
jgi:hypothetical protein